MGRKVLGALWERLTSLINTFGKEASPSAAGGYSVHVVGVLDLQLPSGFCEGNYPKENALRVAEGEDGGGSSFGDIVWCLPRISCCTNEYLP